MSVRKRQWFTGKQVAAYAARRDIDVKVAAKELARLLKSAREKDALAQATLDSLPEGACREAWLVDYVDQAGKRQFATYDKKKDADAFHATARVEIANGTHTPPGKSRTVAEAAEAWIAKVKDDGRERTTVRQYRQHVDLHIVPRIGATKLAHLSKTGCEAFRSDLLKSLSRSLARKVFVSFKSILKMHGFQHVATGVSVERNKRHERKLKVGRDIPDPAEVKLIVQTATKPRERAILMTVAFTGLRASELRGLTWADVDLRHRELTVNQRADRYNQIGRPKSDDSEGRTIPLPSIAVEALTTWKAVCPPSAADLVFPTSTGAIEHHSNLLRSLAPVLIAAGVVTEAGKPKYALHAFRHFFASWCLNSRDRGGLGMGADPKGLQTLLGHSSITMTFDIYGHLFPKARDHRVDEAAAAIFR